MKPYLFTDIDECAEGTHQCDEHADCADTEGSYDCICHQGYDGDGFSCDGKPLPSKQQINMQLSRHITYFTDVDECRMVKCGNNATCKNTPGSYECLCDTGYEGDGHNCTSKFRTCAT